MSHIINVFHFMNVEVKQGDRNVSHLCWWWELWDPEEIKHTHNSKSNSNTNYIKL